MTPGFYQKISPRALLVVCLFLQVLYRLPGESKPQHLIMSCSYYYYKGVSPRRGLTTGCGLAHARCGRGCRQIEAVNPTVLARGQGVHEESSMVESGGTGKDEADPTPCVLHRVFSDIRLKACNGARYSYTTQSCEHFRPVIFAIRRLFVCGGGVLAAM